MSRENWVCCIWWILWRLYILLSQFCSYGKQVHRQEFPEGGSATRIASCAAPREARNFCGRWSGGRSRPPEALAYLVKNPPPSKFQAFHSNFRKVLFFNTYYKDFLQILDFNSYSLNKTSIFKCLFVFKGGSYSWTPHIPPPPSPDYGYGKVTTVVEGLKVCSMLASAWLRTVWYHT